MSELLRCAACGGAVVWDAAESGAACLFCGSIALELHMLTEPLPSPDEFLPMTITAADAERTFRSWARRSWFRPRALAAVEIGLRPMLLPAWRFAATLETHWAGLRVANSASGRRPAAGVEHGDATTMVPASTGVSQPELLALQPFDQASARPWSEHALEPGTELIWEPPVLTRRGARIGARRGLAAAHADKIAGDHRLTRCRVDTLVDERDVRLLLVPIYIGVFRFRDRPWRFLINGQTGAVVGETPIDRAKLVAVAMLVMVILGVWLWLDSRG